MIRPSEDNQYYELHSPTALPKASGFLWNEKMMIHMNCRGYAVAQFMQPEPSKYSHAPNLEAKTFMQPEQPYYAHHPGRFVYIKDEETGGLFSAPYEPVRVLPERYTFFVGKHEVKWQVQNDGIAVEMKLGLPKNDPLELWTVKVSNQGRNKRKISVYPYYTVGYMSWMNQSGQYHEELQSIVCTSVTPYQKYKDYDKIKHLNDKTFLLADRAPTAWEANQEVFEGEGGLGSPTALQGDRLSGSDARYEMPACVMQYKLELDPGEETELRFIFGPVRTEEDIAGIRRKYFQPKAGGSDGFGEAEAEYAAYVKEGAGCLEIDTPDKALDNFVNHWLPRQMYYHGRTNRLTTDPQTRNYLQDNMGMSYMAPELARQAFLTALSQQNASGAMPDGIILHKDAELKYINQVPHTDHCVWLPICLSTYLDETDDYSLLEEKVAFTDSAETATVYHHIDLAMDWLLKTRDERGLNYIEQGDWCDPMNMVGYKGKGVSGWLTMASGYAFRVWGDICENYGRIEEAAVYRQRADETNEVVNRYLWDGNWYARGITDDNVPFGISSDKEGKVFINPQGWSLMCGAADGEKKAKLMQAVTDHLESPYGVEKLGPSYTAMREDVGRVTQKHPGTAENGAVYNHAAAFYIYALYLADEQDHAFDLLRRMIPGPDQGDLERRGQLPVFIPNYYRGAYRQIPRTAGRSSHLFNTGTVPWVYRILVDGLFGLKGERGGLRVAPRLPSDWREVSVKRSFRGAELHVSVKRDKELAAQEVYVDGELAENGLLVNLESGKHYEVLVKIPG